MGCLLGGRLFCEEQRPNGMGYNMDYSGTGGLDTYPLRCRCSGSQSFLSRIEPELLEKQRSAQRGVNECLHSHSSSLFGQAIPNTHLGLQRQRDSKGTLLAYR
jgi:hypothetical protein